MDDKIVTVPYIVYESAMTRNERHIKRLLIALVISIILVFVSNIAWLTFVSQYDYEMEEYSDIYTQEGEGRFNLNTGDQGDVSYGEADVQEDIP